jgi:molybdenum cofactor cytidylyltransferase
LNEFGPAGARSVTNQVGVVVLAAGRGTRFGGDQPKQLAVLDGRTLLARALDAAIESRVGAVTVVVSDDRVADAVSTDAVSTDAVSKRIEVLRNDAPELGIASSLQVALRALTPRDGPDAVIVGLADQPRVGADAYRRLAMAYDDGAELAVASYAGRRGNPVLLGRRYWPEALELTGDEGARVLLRRYGPTEVPCDGTGDPSDIDTPEDLAALEERSWRSTTASE